MHLLLREVSAYVVVATFLGVGFQKGLAPLAGNPKTRRFLARLSSELNLFHSFPRDRKWTPGCRGGEPPCKKGLEECSEKETLCPSHAFAGAILQEKREVAGSDIPEKAPPLDFMLYFRYNVKSIVPIIFLLRS